MKNEHFFRIMFYILLSVILIIGVVLLYLQSGYPSKQFNVGVVSAVLYFLLGILYHKLKDDLHTKIVIEYLLIAVISVVLLRGAILY